MDRTPRQNGGPLTLASCVAAAQTASDLLVPTDDSRYDTATLMARLKTDEQMARAIQQYGITLFFVELRKRMGLPEFSELPQA